MIDTPTREDWESAFDALEEMVKEARAELEQWAEETYPDRTPEQRAEIVETGMKMLADKMRPTP